ncbi:hypothetical protein [uncultured Tateyamaria sp.]|uniref:hypothetical protein n=1 Tax=uncultured Tateyamaria sp. TaxID=455651 RepID=UPI002620DF7B|nr:hypothetical protein [uncultured Tateyamaria sp.]
MILASKPQSSHAFESEKLIYFQCVKKYIGALVKLLGVTFDQLHTTLTGVTIDFPFCSQIAGLSEDVFPAT